MNARAKAYASLTMIGAITCSVALYLSDAGIPANSQNAVILLSTLALIAEALGLWMPNSVIGSIAFIPYLALALIVPNWIALVAAVVVRVVLEAMSRRPALTVLFNIGQQAITFSTAVFVFRLFGGESMTAYAHLPLARV